MQLVAAARTLTLSLSLCRCLRLSLSHACISLSTTPVSSCPHLICRLSTFFFIGKSPFNALVPRHRSPCWLFVFSLFLFLLLLLYFVFLCARLFNRIFYRLFRCVSFSLPIAASSRGVLSLALLLLSCSSLASVACFGGFLLLKMFRCFRILFWYF